MQNPTDAEFPTDLSPSAYYLPNPKLCMNRNNGGQPSGLWFWIIRDGHAALSISSGGEQRLGCRFGAFG